MTKLDRQFAESRQRAMSKPITRANTSVFPDIELSGGVFMALSLNK